MTPARWPATKETRLRELWSVGISASLIADELNVTRNAVIGKAHRLKLPPHRVLEKKDKPPPKWKPIVKIKPQPPPSMKTIRNLLALSERSCRWPINDDTRNMIFCGRETEEKRSYCEEHQRKSRFVRHD